MLASGSGDKTVRLWDLNTETPEKTLSGVHKNWVLLVSFSPDGKLLASGGMDNNIVIWDPFTGK
jgi:ribosome assembly protein 4